MIRNLLRKLAALLSPPTAPNGKPGGHDLEEILRRAHQEILRLSDQISSHAECSPYPHVAERLRRIAAEKQKTAAMLKEKILPSGAEPRESRTAIKSGKNHWERMVEDLADEKALESSFLEEAARVAEENPSVSDLLRKAAAEQSPHRETLLDLVARADPQAEQS